MLACKEGNIEIVTELIEHGADIDHHDENYNTALFEAVVGDNVDTVKLLLSHGALVNETKFHG